jgi:uncharacterized protein YqeY
MLETQIKEATRDAMRAKDKSAILTLRSLQTSILNHKINENLNRDGTLADETVQKILRTELKKRREAAEAYEKGGNTEAATDEMAEAKIIEAYLPQPLTDEELELLVSKIKTENPDANFGQLMREVMAAADGRADGKRVQKLLR